MHPLLRYAAEKQESILRVIEEMARLESPSDSHVRVNEFVDLVVAQTRDIAKAKRTRTRNFGDILRLEFQLPGKKKEGQILGLGHSDTVWPIGTLQKMPVRREKGRIWGPGVLDMKSGLAFFLSAVRAIRDLELDVRRRVALLVVPDEEVGSPESREITEAEAKRSDFVLVLEPGTDASGKLKTARKGVGRYVLSVEGKPAHAGVDFSNGASAILEVARQVEGINALTNLSRGITVNPGVISGGTRSNVVAAQARVEIDLRAPTKKDALATERRLRALRPFDRRCKVRVEGGLNRPPMERTKAIGKLFAKAQAIGAEMGLDLEESSTGGASDGNFTAALGIPTLDGLGGVGEGAHASNESILTNRIADRVALIAGLLSQL